MEHDCTPHQQTQKISILTPRPYILPTPKISRGIRKMQERRNDASTRTVHNNLPYQSLKSSKDLYSQRSPKSNYSNQNNNKQNYFNQNNSQIATGSNAIKVGNCDWASVVKNGTNKHSINPWVPNSFSLPLLNRWNAPTFSEN